MAVLSLDLGGTKIYGRVRCKEKFIDKKVFLPPENFIEQDIKLLSKCICELKKSTSERITRCVIATAPTVNKHGIIECWPNRSHWQYINLKEVIQNIINCPIIFEDDGNTAAIAEADARSTSNLIYVGLGTGVSGGIIIDNKVYRGNNNQAAEFGHIVIFPKGAPCRCGKLGCLQAYASGPAIFSRAFPNQENIATLNIHKLRQALFHKNLSARSALEEASDALAYALSNLIELLDPHIIIIGGSIGIYLPELVQQVKEGLHTITRLKRITPEIEIAKYGADSSIAGADILAQL